MTLKDTAFRVAILKALKDAVAGEEGNARVEVLGDILAAQDALGVKSVDVSLPDGTKIATLSLAGGEDKPQITDEKAFTAWAKANHPSEVEMVERVRGSFVAVALKAPVDTSTGEVIPGVEFVPASRYTRLAYVKDGREAIARAWRLGELAMVDPYPPQLPEVEAAS